VTALLNLHSGITVLQALKSRDRAWVTTHLVKDGALHGTLADFMRRITPAVSSKRAPSVFLSHSHSDKTYVRTLAIELERFGLTVWLDEAQLHVGDSLIAKLSEAIRKIDLVVAVMSKASVKSAWVREELQWAMSHQVARRRVKVLPVVVEPCNRPAFLDGRLFADFSTPAKRKANLEPLVESIYFQARKRRT
jgi:predicted nucleotide-binding protein